MRIKLFTIMLVIFKDFKRIGKLDTNSVIATDATLVPVKNIQCVQLYVIGLKWQLVYPLTDILKFE